ncbi:hypothetical protein Plhal304r1_c063g0150861 [Plasmopara halstedii]
MGIIDHEGDAPTRCVVEHTHVQEPTEFADCGTDTFAQDAVESAGWISPIYYSP